MQFYGLQKTTLLDYPEHVAATVFTSGCNFRCPFCHNMNLVEDISVPVISEEEILSFLDSRKKILDGVCITGGEPTINPDLPDFIRKIKDLGLNVKLDTNGTNPDMLKSLIDQSLIDYVAMDIKTSIDNYPEVCGIDNFDSSSIIESIDILINSSIDYEFRTTMIKEYHNSQVMDNIGKMLKGCNAYYLQSFKDSDFVPNHSLHAYNKEELSAFAQQLNSYIGKVEIRGVD